jgi:hypothetical protein
VDAYGNVYFTDTTSSSVSVVYRGGTQVANFIALVNPAGGGEIRRPGAGGVRLPHRGRGQPEHMRGLDIQRRRDHRQRAGLREHNQAIPGTIMGATVNSPNEISLDSAGNIYIADISNHTTRVINTQATPQTFFQYTVQPGYMRSITDCNASMTTPCPGLTTGRWAPASMAR